MADGVQYGQTGDVSSGDHAGGNIYNGLDPVLLRYLEGERNSRDASAMAIIRIHDRLDALARDARRDAEDAAMERAIDFEARIKRQAQTDAAFAAVQRWLAALTVVLGLAVLIIVWLVWREAALLAARAVFDAALAHAP